MPQWKIDFNPRVDTRRPDILRLIVHIEALRRSIAKIPLPPMFREDLDRINIVRQIKGTTGIEGNTLSEARIREVLEERGEAETRASDSSSVEEQEVINANEVIHFIRHHVESNPEGFISEELIRHLHYISTVDCNYENNVPGHYRRHSVVAGDYVAPDHVMLPRLMNQFVEVINSREVREGYGPLIRAILAHFYLISIHPFGDGNGRTSRAVEAYILYHGRYNVRGFYSLANFYYRKRAEYIHALQGARFKHDGDLTNFVIFSLRGFLEELKVIEAEILDFVRRRLFRDVYLEAYRAREINARGASLLEHLTFVESEGIPLRSFKNKDHYLALGLYGDLTPKTLLRDLRKLQDLDLITIQGEMLMANLQLMDEFL